jgi:hypothetical protein
MDYVYFNIMSANPGFKSNKSWVCEVLNWGINKPNRFLKPVRFYV